MNEYISRRMLDRAFRYLMKTFKGWDIEFDIEKKENHIDVKSINISVTYNEKYTRGE